MALGLQGLDLLDQNLRIDDDAIANDAKFIRMKRAGRNQVKNGFFPVDD